MPEEHEPDNETPNSESNAGASEPASIDEQPSKLKQYIQRFGVAGFLFFTIKGLLWLIVPALIAMGWFGECSGG